MKIDRVYYNGVIRTMVSEGDTVEALAVHNGTIVAAGTSKEMRTIDACASTLTCREEACFRFR